MQQKDEISPGTNVFKSKITGIFFIYYFAILGFQDPIDNPNLPAYTGPLSGRLAQLVRASPLQGEGLGFESLNAHHIFGSQKAAQCAAFFDLKR